jgi:hypothetical protein
MALGISFVNVAIAPTYIVCKIRSEAKRYVMKNSIVDITNLIAHYMQLLY